MKILILLAYLLTISYAVDPQKIRYVYDIYKNCLVELNEQQWTPTVVKCYFQKAKLINEQGMIEKEKHFAVLSKIISDENKLSQAKEIASTCINQGYQGPGSNDEKLMTIIKCGMSITNLIDKPQ